MNRLVLGDTHFGASDGSILMVNHQLNVLDVVIDYCIDNNITEIIQTGDFFDVRKSTNTLILYKCKEFVNKCKLNNINISTIVSNHDIYYKNTLKINTLTENLSHFSNVTIYDSPMEVGDILYVPWICKTNQEECLNAIKTTKCKICVCHPEIVNCDMGGSICKEGLSLSMFDNFDTVIAGHFHKRGQYNNVTYVGVPYQLSWSDYGEDKGFHILEDNKLTFHKLDFPLFHRFTYDEDKDMDIILDNSLTDTFVKLIVENRTDYKKYDIFITKLQNCGIRDLKIYEPMMDLNSDDSYVMFDGELTIKSTENIISEYISDLYPEKADKLTKMMLSLHNEAKEY